GDLNGDAVVNSSDLAALLASWGSCIALPSWALPIEGSPDPAVVTDPSLRAAIAATGLAWRVRERASGVEMLLVPPGAFTMGASPGDALASPQEHPAHAVAFPQAYYLGRYEVTQLEFKRVTGFNPSYFTGPGESAPADRPVETVHLAAVGAFLNATGLRLPTEAEWERACRAGTTGANYGVDGQPLESIAWYAPNSGFVTRGVGLKAANPLGFHDMLGNVWEWCGDWYDGAYYQYSPEVDPQGPSTGTFRVIRGGSWYAPLQNTRVSFRGAVWPGGMFGDVGFRVARDP
ncbi:MAG: formylglycine-generating enzyme family protein, partial [Planctomycetota bacterium]